MGYGLAEGLSYCTVGPRTAFLDLPNDRYFVLSGACDRAFRDFVDDPTKTTAAELALLQSHQLVSPDGSAPSLCTQPRPVNSLFLDGFGGSPGDVPWAALSYFRASWRLRHWGLARTVEHYRLIPSSIELDDEESRRLAIVAGFRSLRLLVDPTDKCLPLSFAMAYELKRRRCRAAVVFGITLSPFRAHCWTQFGDLVLNDRLDRVLDFQPILVL